MRPKISPASSWSGTTSQWWSHACGPRPFMVEVKPVRCGVRAMAAVCGTRKQPSTSKAGSSSGRISSTETRHCGACEHVVPAGDGARHQQPGRGVDELDHDLLEVQRAGDAVAHLLEHLVDRAALGQARGDLQQLLERGAVARGLDGLLRALQGARGERDHGHEQVELVVGRAHAGDRLADRDDAEQVPVGVPAGHEQLVAGDPGVGGPSAIGWSGT